MELLAMADQTWIKQNAELVIELCQSLVDFEFGYDEQSVAWLEDYIVRMRQRGAFETSLDKFTAVYGSYLGEAIIAAHGGEWSEDEDGFPCVLYRSVRIFPMNKVAKLMRDGLEGGDSILSFYKVIPNFVEIIEKG
jgi:hypothetical protein